MVMAETTDITLSPSSAPAAYTTPSAPSKKSKATSSSSTTAAKKAHTKAAHPRTSEMVVSAIKELKEKGGSSLQAIKKYMAANYKVDPDKLSTFIKKYLKSAVASGDLVQTKGKGASGSFKLASASKNERDLGVTVVTSVASLGKRKKATVSKSKPLSKGGSATKKAAATKTVTGGRRATAASTDKTKKKQAAVKKKPSPSPASKLNKSQSKAKKVSKAPTKKPKAPKAKAASAAKSKSSPRKKREKP